MTNESLFEPLLTFSKCRILILGQMDSYRWDPLGRPLYNWFKRSYISNFMQETVFTCWM